MKKLVASMLALSMAMTMGAGVASTGMADAAAEPTTISILGYERNPGFMNGRENQGVWKAAEKMFADAGLNFNFEIVADRDQYKTTIQTRLASAYNLPDLFYGGETDTTDLLDMADQGIVLKMNEVLETTKGNAYNFFYGGEGDQARKLISDTDGNFYWLPRIQVNQLDGQNAGTSMCICIRQDWLKALSMTTPTNLDEFTAALQAFQDNDSNGNGVKDEVLVSDTSLFNVGMNLWFGIPTCDSTSVGIDLTTGKVQSAWDNANIKDYFTYVQQLVSSGLLSSDYIGTDTSSNTDMTANKVSATEYYPVGTYQEAAVIAGGCPDAYYIGIYPFDAVEGTKAFYSEETPYLQYLRHCVSNAAEGKMEAIATMYDTIYSEDFLFLMQNGVEGENFKYADDGSIINLDGTTSTQDRFDTGRATSDEIWRMFFPTFKKNERLDELNKTAAGGYQDKVDYEMATNGYSPKTPNDNSSYYALATPEEQEILAEYTTDLTTASREIAAKLSLGEYSVDDIDTYIQELKDAGLDEIVAVRQAQYDRANGSAE